VVDPAPDDTILPINIAARIGVRLRPPTGHGVRWRGQLHPLRFGDVEIVLRVANTIWRWRTVVGFSPVPLHYPILGRGGCLQFFDTRFLGVDLIVELETNPSYPGTIS
jgi:hypothetical protein